MGKIYLKLMSYLALAIMQLSGFADEPSQRRALVTGGAGFLGSHMCEYLLEKGYKVMAVDNLYTGSLDNIESFKDHPDFRFIYHDIINPFEEDIAVDEIYNLACPASPQHYQKDPIFTLKTSVWGAIHLLELAKKHHAKIFQSSTSEVYGDPDVHPQKESYWGNVNPFGIRSCYDEGKRCAETCFYDYHLQYGVKIKVGRIFNTYGPRMGTGDGRVVPNFIMQALKNDPITVFGSGEQTRSFCYVSDLIEGIYRLMQSDDAVIGPMNIGNPHEFTMLELASCVIRLTHSKSGLCYQQLPADDPKKRRPDIKLATSTLGWEPVVQLEEGLKSTIDYFMNKTDGSIATNSFN